MAIDFSPISNAPINAMQAAAYGDQLQEQRYQNRLMHMANDEALREKSVANLVAGAFYQDGQQPQAPAAPANTLVAPSPTAQQPQAPAAPQMPGGVAAPTAQQPQAAQPRSPFDVQRVKLAELYKAGRITAADAQKYDEQITVKEQSAREQQSKATFENLKAAAEQGKLDESQLKQVQEKMEPIIRATAPIQQQYDKLINSGKKPAEAIAAVQPMYHEMIANISQIPGYEAAAKQAPKDFNPSMAYLAKDTYTALEKAQTAQQTRDSKEGERKATQFVTKSGQIITEDLKGNQFADGKPYHGPAYREKPGGGTPSAPTGPSDGAAGAALKGKGGVPKAVEVASEYFIFTGKMPPLGNGKESGRVRVAVMENVGKIADQLHMTLPQLFAQSDDVKANVASMVNLKKQMGVVDAAETQAQKNFDRLEKLYPSLGNGAVPMMNKVINAIKKGTGNPAPGTAAGVTYEAMMEYAKVISGQTTGAAVTDGASEHAQELLDILRVNPAEFKAKLENYRGMMVDRKKSLTDSYGGMLDHIGQIKTGGTAPGVTTPRTQEPPAQDRISQASRRIASDLRGNWADAGRQQLIYKNLKANGYSDPEIGQAFAAAKGSR